MIKLHISKKIGYFIADILQKMIVFIILCLILGNLSFSSLKCIDEATFPPGTNTISVNIEYNIFGFQLFRSSNNSEYNNIPNFGYLLGGNVYTGGYLYFLGIFFAFYYGEIWKSKFTKNNFLKFFIFGSIFVLIIIGPIFHYNGILELKTNSEEQYQQTREFYSDYEFDIDYKISQNLVHFLIYPILMVILELLIYHFIFKKIKSLKKDFWQRFTNKNFSEISLEDIEKLIVEEIRESNELEYKSDYGRRQEGLAQEIIALANTEGGYIILGIDEIRINNKNTGIPSEIVGVVRMDHETRITDIAISNSRPKIVPLIRVFKLDFDDNDKDIVVIQIKKSKEPIMFTKKKNYYHRVNDKKSPADHEWVSQRFFDFF